MEEIAGSFFDNYEEGFLEYLEVHKAQALKDREDYQTLNKKISELKYKYPNVRTFLEEKEPIDLRDDEQYAILNVLDYENELDVIELKESFKLGFKEALIYLNNMGMLKLNQFKGTDNLKNLSFLLCNKKERECDKLWKMKN